MKKVSLFLLSLLLFSHLIVSAQYYNFQNYTVEEGLPQSQVFAMYQDSRSNLWFGTNGGGLCRFNGKGFDVYTRNDGLGSDLITDIIEDKEGNLVIKTVNGISLFNGNTFSNYVIDSTRNVNTDQMYMDKNGHIWFRAFLNNNAPVVYKFDGNNLIRADEEYEVLKNVTFQNHMISRRNGDLIISIGEELYINSGDGFELHTFSDHDLLKGKTINFIHEDIDGNLMMAAQDRDNNGGLYMSKTDGLEKFQLHKDLQNSGGYGFFFEDNDGSFWLLANNTGNLFKWDRKKKNKVEELNENTGVPFNTIRAMLHDNEGNIWIGTDGSGLYKNGGSKFISFLSNQGMEDYFIWSIFEDDAGNMWFGTSNNSVLQYDGNVLNSFDAPDNQPFNIVRCINEFNNEILVGSFNGLWASRNNSFVRVNTEYGLPQFVGVNDLLVHEGKLYVSTTGEGLYLIDKEGNRENFRVENSNIGGNNVNDIILDNDGSIWFSSAGSINKYDGKAVKNYRCNQYFGHTRIMQLATDNSENIWVATYGSGLCKVSINASDEISATTYDISNGLSSNNVYSVIEGPEGNIWAGCQNGVDKITLTPEGDLVSIRNYDNYEGFTGFENNGKASFKDKKGNLWFGTIRGVMVYDKLNDIPNTQPPVTSITKLKLFYKDVNWDDVKMNNTHTSLAPWTGLPTELVLPHNNNHLSFEFEGLSYTVPEKVVFQWMLEGLDEDWSPPNTRSDAVYANLSPGSYTLLVKASNNDGVWNEVPAAYSFIIKSPFYGTWWFRGIVLVFLFTLTIVIFWLRNKFIQEKREELEQLVAFKTKKLEQQKDEILRQNDELQNQYTNLELLSKMGRDITANLTIESLLDSVYGKLNTLMDASVLGFGIFNTDKSRLEFPVLISKGEKITIPAVDFDNKNSLAVQCLIENREIVINSFSEEKEIKDINERPPVLGDDSLSIIFIPLIYKDKPLGVLTVQSTTKDAYSEYHINILRNLAIYANIALENSKSYERIQEHRNRLSQANQDIVRQKQEIEVSNKKLLEINDEKNSIIEIVAHDIKNPLTSAFTMADILKTESNNLEDDQKHCIFIIEKSIKRINDMINRLLDVRKIEDKIVELKLEKVNLQEIIKDVNNLLSNELNRKKINISLEAEDLYANVDPDYAVQVFENLISNAIKFSPPKKKVVVKLLKDNGKARTEIIDEGPGLTKEDHSRVFGKFQRLSARPTGGEQSTGLGLSIVKKYVEAMDGKVWCESEAGKGANFIVEFTRMD